MAYTQTDAAPARPPRTTELVKPGRPDFLIKFEPNSEPSPPGGYEELVMGSESDAADVVRNLIASGRATPGRIWIYANTNADIATSVTFPRASPAPGS